MTLPGPVFLMGGLFGGAVVLQLLRRWTGLMAWLAVVITGGMSLFIALVPLGRRLSLGPVTVSLGDPLNLFGRLLIIEPVDRLPIMFIGTTAALIFVIAWRLLPHSNFFPVGLAIVALLAGSLMVEQVVFAALMIEMAAVLTVFPLHEPVERADGRRYGGRIKGGLQYLVYATLALPGLMVTQLLLEQFAIFPADLQLLRTATILLSLSLALLLGAVPFQSWLSSVATDGSPPVVTFLFTINVGTVWFLLLAYLETYRWLSVQTAFGSLFTSVGLLMMVIGGALAASQRRLGRLVGYATLVDNGAMFVAIGTGQVAGLSLTLIILMARPLALGLMTLGLDGLRRLGKGSDAIDQLAGAAWRAPWRTLAFMVGGVAMAGFPLSPGFAARWGLYRLMAEASLFQAVLALVGSSGVMMGLISAVRALLTPGSGSDRGAALTEDRVVVILIFVLLGCTLALGLFPQPLSQVALQMAQGFSFFAP